MKINQNLIDFIEEHDTNMPFVRKLSAGHGSDKQGTRKWYKKEGNGRRRTYTRALIHGRISNYRPATSWDIW